MGDSSLPYSLVRSLFLSTGDESLKTLESWSVSPVSPVGDSSCSMFMFFLLELRNGSLGKTFKRGPTSGIYGAIAFE